MEIHQIGADGLAGEVFQDSDEGVGSRLAEAANRGVAHGVRQFCQQTCIPRPLRHQLDRLLAADPAGRALAAGFILEEPEQVQGHGPHRIAIRQDDDGMGADKAAVLLQGSEVEFDARDPAAGERHATVRGPGLDR